MVAAEAVDLVEVEEEVVAVVDSEAEEVDLEVEAARVETAKEGMLQFRDRCTMNDLLFVEGNTQHFIH